MSKTGSLHRIYYLAKKDVLLEIRNIYSAGGILLYLICSVFIVYKVLNRSDPVVWNAIYWTLFLFVGVSAMMKSFVKESGRSALFHYSLFNPYEVLIAKLVYNLVFMFCLSILLFVALCVFMPVQIGNIPLLLLTLFLASLGISVNFSFITAITSQGSQNATLLSVMAFPVVLPILLMSLKLSAQALNILSDTAYISDILMLLAIDLMAGGLSLLLFPFVWKS